MIVPGPIGDRVAATEESVSEKGVGCQVSITTTAELLFGLLFLLLLILL